MMTKMTYSKATDEVLGFRMRHGRIPMQEDYERRMDGLDLEALVEALEIDMKPKEKLGVPAYAAVNIEVLHEDRRRKGQIVHIANVSEDDVPAPWGNNSNLFARKV